MAAEAERKLAMRDYLSQVRHTTLAELMDEFHVSKSTVRRDLDYLETELNVPLLRNQGNNGGISVMDGWSAQRIYLSPAQEQLLQKLLPTLADDDKATMETILQKFCNPCSR
ncbi:DeoR family transcriptional regulator [Bilifractor sp. HCP3S3_D3]|uniref:DeoR family transcriptional regulator n=1 Tax=Bilifractor sp. HCP3S3_D3 TaxID=3438907 RepID=UPI003F8967C8